jgi:hypothetical protein
MARAGMQAGKAVKAATRIILRFIENIGCRSGKPNLHQVCGITAPRSRKPFQRSGQN